MSTTAAHDKPEPSWMDPSNDVDENVCTHPNGFGPNGCACGATLDGENVIEPSWPIDMREQLKAAVVRNESDRYDGDGEEFPQVVRSQLDSETPFSSNPNFEEFWAGWVREQAPVIAEKAANYGSNSLAEMGALFARQGGRTALTQAEALEIGCAVYAYGKMQRVVDAMLMGKQPGTDTLGDLMVYAAMSLYIRETKQWP